MESRLIAVTMIMTALFENCNFRLALTQAHHSPAASNAVLVVLAIVVALYFYFQSQLIEPRLALLCMDVSVPCDTPAMAAIVLNLYVIIGLGIPWVLLRLNKR